MAKGSQVAKFSHPRTHVLPDPSKTSCDSDPVISNHEQHLLYFQGSEAKAASSASSAPPASSAPASAPKVIPRLVDSSGTTPLSRSGGNSLDPATWDVDDVSSFLGINECATLVESFKEQVSSVCAPV